MGENRECKIVQDLLPNYIENLTDEETNKYIEEHIGNCEKCKIAYENMKQELKVSTEKSDKREIKQINGFKKINSKLKFFKVTLFLIILILLLIFVVNTGRKMIIISSLSNKAKEYENSTNYHMILYNNEKNKLYQFELYKMGDKIKKISICMQNNEFQRVVSIGHKNIEKGKEIPEDDFYDVHTYYDETPEFKNKKIAVIDDDMAIAKKIFNPLYTDNLWELFKLAIKSSVKSSTIYGKKCYHMTNSERFCPEGIYFDKETGVHIIQSAETEQDKGIVGLSERIYEFNVVTENDFIEPDISEYESMTAEEYHNIIIDNNE